MKSLETISNEITLLESERDFGDITPEGLELLDILNLCYDLLTRTKIAQAEIMKQPDEMKEPGFENEYIPVYGITSNQLADFTFSVRSSQGKVDLRKLLREVMASTTQTKVAQGTGIRQATISDYLTGKSPFNCDSYENVLNYCINGKISG